MSLFQMTLMASAYDINVDGIRYNFTSDSTVEVTYIKLGPMGSPFVNEEYMGDMVIPASINYEDKKYAVTSISEYAFIRCPSLKSVKLPSSIVTIGNSAFSNCPALESIEIPEGVKEVGESFVDCKNLKSIVLPSSITKMHLFIIRTSDRVEKIVCNAVTPPTITIGDWAESVVKDTPDEYIFHQCALRVPKESVEAYKATYGWNKFCDIGPYSPDEVFKPVEPKSTLPAPTLDPRAVEKDMSEFLKLSSYDPFKWTQDDHFIMQRALNRMTLKHEGTKVTVQDTKASDLNMSEELFNLIKDGFEDGYSVPEASE
jgi:hypothetical protein